LFAAIAASRGDGLQAARLVGTAGGVRQRAGMPIATSDGAVLERYVAPARAALGPDRWEAQVAAGAALTDSQAFALVETTAQRSAD